MYDIMLKEMTVGCEQCPDVKTGFIGEVGSTWPIEGSYFSFITTYSTYSNFIFFFLRTEFEKRAIKATGELEEQLKCPVSFHPGRNSAAPFEIMRLYQEAGGNASKAILSHLDRTFH